MAYRKSCPECGSQPAIVHWLTEYDQSPIYRVRCSAPQCPIYSLPGKDEADAWELWGIFAGDAVEAERGATD